MIRYFPRIQRSDVSIRQIDSHDHILSAFDRSIAAYATDHFRRSGIDLVLNCRVSACSFNAFTSIAICNISPPKAPNLFVSQSVPT